MTSFSDGGKHVWLATAKMNSLLARATTKTPAEIVHINHEYHQDQGQPNSHSGNHNSTYTTCQHGAVPPSPVSSAFACAPGKRLGGTHNPSGNPNARQSGTFAPVTDSATAVRHTRPVRRRHYRGYLLWFRKMLECWSFAFHIARPIVNMLRAHGLLRRPLTIFTA